MAKRSKNVCHLLALGMMALLWASCNDVFDIHPYDVDFGGETDINKHNSDSIRSKCRNKDTLRFVVTGDTQGWYDELRALVKDVNKHNVDFVIHGGDVTNYGATHEFERQRKILDGLKVPYVVLIGNHDCLGTGIEVYKKMFGDTNFSFIAGNVKFVCLNTNALEYDYSEPIPDFDYMETELDKDIGEYERTVICMHAPPFNEQFNNNVVKAFNHYVCLFPNVLFCTAAHVHRFEYNDLFSNGIYYFCCDSANHRSYIIFTVTPDSYSYELVEY